MDPSSIQPQPSRRFAASRMTWTPEMFAAPPTEGQPASEARRSQTWNGERAMPSKSKSANGKVKGPHMDALLQAIDLRRDDPPVDGKRPKASKCNGTCIHSIDASPPGHMFLIYAPGTPSDEFAERTTPSFSAAAPETNGRPAKTSESHDGPKLSAPLCVDTNCSTQGSGSAGSDENDNDQSECSYDARVPALCEDVEV
ncbi:MAG: hypothetical protein SGPRY_002854, partial [Prymnesium sp.]